MASDVGHHHETRNAWIAVALIPVGFLLAFLVGEGLFSLMGYESDGGDAPFWAVAVAGGAGIALFAAPCVAAWVLGRRAEVAGDPQGRLPAWIGAVVGVLFVVLNVVAYLAS